MYFLRQYAVLTIDKDSVQSGNKTARKQNKEEEESKPAGGGNEVKENDGFLNLLSILLINQQQYPFDRLLWVLLYALALL